MLAGMSILHARKPEIETVLMRDSGGSSETKATEIHVLAVDDSDIDRKVIESLLKTLAYKVTAVNSGRRALEILGVGETLGSVSVNAYEISLIITDYCMPGMTGYDLLKRIKETSALREIPVVIMSSDNFPNRISSCLAEGAEEFLQKPVQLADVKQLRGRFHHSGMDLADQITCTKNKIASSESHP